MKIGDEKIISGIHIVCVPDYLITRVGMDPGTSGILLPPTAAAALIAAMRRAGIVPGQAHAGPTTAPSTEKTEPTSGLEPETC